MKLLFSHIKPIHMFHEQEGMLLPLWHLFLSLALPVSVSVPSNREQERVDRVLLTLMKTQHMVITSTQESIFTTTPTQHLKWKTAIPITRQIVIMKLGLEQAD